LAETPRTIAHWTVVEELGRGDFGTVYKVRVGDSEYALKLCAANNPASVERMGLEAAALGRLAHPNIPQLVDRGTYEGRPYLVMSFARGQTLKDTIIENQTVGRLFGDIEAMSLIAAILRAVAHIHEQGFVHRDVKDANVIATPLCDSVTLIDFGFCKEAGHSATRTSDSFWRVGAARFSPPAKLTNPALAVPSHDVFAVGAIGYRMLTGDYPWSVSEHAGGVRALRDSQLGHPLIPVIDRNSHVAPRASALISKLLEVRDERRPSAEEALSEVERFLEEARTDAGRLMRGKGRPTYPHTSRDPLYGDIRLTEYEYRALNTVEMQRLRFIRQLGLTNRVYVGADHSRFSHSIGSLARVEQILRTIEDQEGIRIDEHIRSTARLYGLTHDVTHIPFGHTLEDEFNLFTRHDMNTGRAQRLVFDPGSELGSLFNQTEEGRFVRNLFDLESSVRQSGIVVDLVSGLTGADVLDYLDRDAFFCGLDHRIDSAIFRQFRLYPIPRRTDRRLVSVIGGKYGLRVDRELAVESLLEARYAMFLKVYAHPAKLAASSLLAKGITRAVQPLPGGAEPDPDQISEPYLERLGVGDDVLLHRMSESEDDLVRWAADAIQHRRVPTAVYRARLLDKDSLSEGHCDDRQVQLRDDGLFDPSRRAEIEAEIAREARLDARQVMVYCPAKAPGYQRVEHWVASARDASPTRQPPLADVARRHLALWELWLFVADVTDEERRGAVADIAQDRFGFQNLVDLDRRQARLF
jgi:HD superfamily phosphohydrolase/tRNA A-37 threonylcarbamoyl transferase component Bud32